MPFNSTIEIINVSAVSEIKTGKTPYKAVEVAFKSDGKVEGKRLLSFQNESVFATVQNLKQGDMVTITKDKDKNGYWQWTSVEKGFGAPVSVTEAEAPKASTTVSTGRVTGSTYETPEERKIKQRYIVRQSSITAALTFAELTKVAKPSVQGIIGIAQEFEAYVYSEPQNAAVMEMENDVPL